MKKERIAKFIEEYIRKNGERWYRIICTDGTRLQRKKMVSYKLPKNFGKMTKRKSTSLDAF